MMKAEPYRAYTAAMRYPSVWFITPIIVLIAALGAAAQDGATPEQSGQSPVTQPEAAQTTPPAPIETPTVAQVQERIAQVEADEELDDASKDAILAPLRAAVDALQQRNAAQTQRREFADATAAVPGTLEQLRTEVDQPVTTPVLPDYGQMPADQALDAVRAVMGEAQARLDAARAEQARLQAEAAEREQKLATAPTQLVQWGEQLTEATTELAALPQDPADSAAQARRWQKQAEAAELAARIARQEAEVASYTARRELLPLRQTLAQRKADTASRLLEKLRAAETEAANRKARQAQQEARQQADEVADAQLSELAKETSELASRRLGPKGTLERLESVRVEHNRAEGKLAELQRRARNTTARVQAAGLTQIVGQSLRSELRELPRFEPESDDQLKSKIDDAQLKLIEIEEKLLQYRDVQSAIERARQRVANGDEALPPAVEQQITSIITSYVDTLQALESEYRSYIDEAYELAATRKTLAQTLEAFRTYIEERILWTRSVQGSSIPRVEDVVDGGIWLLGGQRVPAGATGVVSRSTPIGTRWLDALADWWPPQVLVFPVTIALIVSFWARRRARRALRSIAGQVRKFNSDRMRLTLEALPLTVVVSLPLPIALALASLLLTGTDVEVAQAVGKALFEAAIFAFVLEFVRHAARTDGLLEAHFRWRRDGLVQLRRLVFLLEASLIPVSILTRAYAHQPDFVINDAVGRLLFMLGQLILAGFTAWAFAPWLSFVQNYLVKHRSGVVNQTRWAWYPLLVAAPLALAVLAGVGYYYTAAQLDERLHLTVWLAVAAIIAYNLVLRWLFIERRRLLVKRAQQRREEEAAERAEKDEGGGGEDGGIEVETPELDAAEVDTQTRRVLVAAVLVSVVLGMYGLWSAQLPALRMLERVQLWPTITVLESDVAASPVLTDPAPPEPETPSDASASEAPASEGSGTGLLGLGSTSEPAAGQSVNVITLADVGAAFLFFAITWVLARNLPGLLEITILKRLPFDAGARFAVTSILRYLLVIVGIFLGFGAIGIGWSQVQFLAAALTFGLAFGLQEIFANFISGLIILVERPMRVGDTVTVNNMNGKVTRIRMRATTLLDWELREVIVPNKVFITQEFTNWTLSDPRIRVTVPVGVSYGSDVRLVQQTLLEIGQSHPHVVTEPRVRSLFLGFADSTLNFELRVYLESYDFFLDVKSELHTRIAERFRELDIEIAFPQRDLNIRSIGPLADVLTQRSSDRDGQPEKPRPESEQP
ncbi:hypothetical protein AY599_18740 [Leptolyngbya valderiana BDU 20041]|nr:hypothetical protein AY599_18740 [Leptolyngbya valderiana BDU 20041]